MITSIHTINRMRTYAFLIICLSVTASIMAQSNETASITPSLKSYSVGVNLTHFYDLPAYRFDTDLSRDMKGLNGDKTKFDLGFDIYLEKQFTPLFGAQLGFRYGKMTGANEVEYYENSFNQFDLDAIFILSNLDALHPQSKWNYYTKLGLGTGTFKAEQFLISDDSPDDEVEDNYWESHIGIGIQYELNHYLRLELESNYTVVFNDGFDGFNNASGSDPFLATSLGVAYTFGGKDKKATYSVNYFGQDYLNLSIVKDEPHVVLPEPEIKEEDLDKLEELVEAQQKQINQTQQKLQNQQIKIDRLEKRKKVENENKVQVYFKFDSKVLSREGKKELSRKFEDLEGKAEMKIELTAYADNNGDERYNEQLRKGRGESVKLFLEQLGYEGENISIITSQIEKKDKENQFLNRKVIIKY